MPVRTRGNGLANALGAALSSASSRARTAPAVFSGSSTSWNLNGLGYSVSRHWRSDLSPATVSISQARVRSSSGSPMKAAKERASPWDAAFGGFAHERGL